MTLMQLYCIPQCPFRHRYQNPVGSFIPCFSADSYYESAINDCVGFIENCLVCYNYNSVVLLGDFNFECDIRNSGYRILSNHLHDHNLQCCASLANPAVDYTYFQDTLGRYSVIDHMFVKSDTFNNVINYSTIESGSNLSDHVPISCVIAMVESGRRNCLLQLLRL